MMTAASVMPLLDRTMIAAFAERLEPRLLWRLLLEAVAEAETACRQLAELTAQPEEAGRVAHRLRGTSLNLGMVRIGQLAAVIEINAGRSGNLAMLVKELEEAVAATREMIFQTHAHEAGSYPKCLQSSINGRVQSN